MTIRLTKLFDKNNLLDTNKLMDPPILRIYLIRYRDSIVTNNRLAKLDIITSEYYLDSYNIRRKMPTGYFLSDIRANMHHLKDKIYLEKFIAIYDNTNS